MKLRIALIVSIFFICGISKGQTLKNIIQKQEQITADISDSLSALNNKFAKWKYTGADTLSNPYYFPLFSRPTFYNMAVHDLIGELSSADSIGYNHKIFQRNQRINDMLMAIYTEKPWIIQYKESDALITPDVIDLNEIKPSVRLTDKIRKQHKTDSSKNILNHFNIEIRKPNFWNFSANFSLQFMQNFISNNWYKGGESTHSLLSSFVCQANYDNKQKTTFNNKLEMRLGFQDSPSDKEHKYRTNSDLIRLTNEFGIKASKHWYYSAMLQTWTQFCPGYKKNDPQVYSDFMSPMESLFSIGMKYTLNKSRFQVDANLSPFACNFRYVSRKTLLENYGLSEKHYKLEYGSNITITHNWNISNAISWSGRFFYYTNYKRTQIEWENTVNLKINKFLSTQLFLYPRFDDSAKRNAKGSYFQFKEYLSLGLSIGF